VAPLDLTTDAFYLTRRAALEERLAELEAGRAPALVRATDASFRGVRCVGVAWDLFPPDILSALLEVRTRPY
jgi:fanconi-associated nuclease 1